MLLRLCVMLCRHILHSVVVRYNNSLIDAETGVPIEDRRKALCDTLRSLQQWERHRTSWRQFCVIATCKAEKDVNHGRFK